jgi:hypothetical protein
MALKEGFRHSFRMHMEGVEVPFTSATIVCTPNGNVANISVYSNEFVTDLKPKTSVQISYQEWTSTKKDKPWRIMFDGFFSKIMANDDATQGRMMSLECRDFRMDIRRAPAAMAWEKETDLTTKNYYNSMGIFQTWVVKGVTPEYQEGEDRSKGKKKGSKGRSIRTFGSLGINDVSAMLRYIAGTAYGKGLTQQDNGEYLYSSKYGTALPVKPGSNTPESGLFLDSIIRGIWLESVGGTTMSAFINKRARIDKRFLVPVNKAGYNFWSRQSASINMGSFFMGNARFTSVESAIMRLASVFSSRVYACSTPTLIPLADEVDGKPNPALPFVMQEEVRDFLVNRSSAEFGAKYMLNETMLLPPLEFTAPPNCNVIFPSMYENVEWQYDSDIDHTRGYFTQSHVLTSRGSNDLSAPNIQIPNTIFDSRGDKGKQKDKNRRKKPPLTLEERYKGINVKFGNVEYKLGADDAKSVIQDRYVNSRAKAALNEQIEEIRALTGGRRYNPFDMRRRSKELGISEAQLRLYENELAKKENALRELKNNSSTAIKNNTTNALKRHALIKFLNSKYAGRVLTSSMHFNPYIMCGFPGLVVSGSDPSDSKPLKDIIGMVQQVKHTIYITSDAADASTTVVLNNARFSDESTDIDANGSPLFMRATDTDRAIIDSDTLDYINPNYTIPDAKSPVKVKLNDDFYDLDKEELQPDYVYAKDLLTLSASDIANGERNQIYVDEVYEPNRIAKFYRDVLRHKTDSLMIGTLSDGNKFMYDTIDEAVQNMKVNYKSAITDYRSAIDFIYRDVCSTDAFFHGILGASTLEVSQGEATSLPEITYVNKTDNFNDADIREYYHGITTEKWESGDIDGLKEVNGGLMTDPGQFSSINETMPATAFIQERRDAVQLYRDAIVDSPNYYRGNR